MKKALPLLLLVIVAIALFFIKRCSHGSSPGSKNKSAPGSTSAEINRDRGFDRRVSYLQYSNHARCRMECRHITQSEVEETMRDGNINYRKSDIQSRSLSGARCPRYAVEDQTKDGQHVRIVFAQCDNYTEVVTVIDLDTEWTCDCPGDDDKYKNKN
jgi:hypothetical protein